MTNPKKGQRVTGVDRERMAAQVAQAYAAGVSIRELAALHGRSYGFIHRVLHESGATVRSRGGDRANRIAT